MEAEQTRPAKRQRIGKACKSCRTSKARCEVNPNSTICHRCQILGLECELPQRSYARAEGQGFSIPTNGNNDVEDRLKKVEQIIARLCAAVFPQDNPVSNETPHTAASPDTHHDKDTVEPVIVHNYPKPVEILQDLQSELYNRTGASSAEQTHALDVVAMGILSSETATKLLRTSIDRYSRWISLADVIGFVDNKSWTFPRDSPLLMNVLCLLATRYHPEISPQTVQDMCKHIKHLVAEAVIETPPVASSVVQALTLLCLFSPAVQTEKPLDSWHLSASTANHAVVAFDPSNIKQSGATEESTIEQLRVWSGLCLTHIQYSIGSGRPLCISLRLVDGCRRLLDVPGIIPSDTPLIAELQFYVCLHTALQNPSATPESAFAHWNLSWGRLLASSGPPTTLELSYWFGHLLLHRRSATSNQNHTSEKNIPAWRQSANIVSQFVRHDYLYAPDLPDFSFFIASYAALVLCESAMDHHLVDNLRAYLFKVACGESHIAFKHGCIVQRALERSGHAGPSGGANGNGGSDQAGEISLPSQAMALGDFDALAGFDIFGEYFTVESLL